MEKVQKKCPNASGVVENYLGHFLEKNAKNTEKIQKIAPAVASGVVENYLGFF